MHIGGTIYSFGFRRIMKVISELDVVVSEWYYVQL